MFYFSQNDKIRRTKENGSQKIRRAIEKGFQRIRYKNRLFNRKRFPTNSI